MRCDLILIPLLFLDRVNMSCMSMYTNGRAPPGTDVARNVCRDVHNDLNDGRHFHGVSQIVL